jgi:hypothetical protein
VLTPPQLNNDQQVIKNLLMALLGLIIIAIIIWVYRQQTTGELSALVTVLEQENHQIKERNIKLTAQNEALTTDNINRQQALAIQKATNNELLQQLNELQDNALEIDKELSFYQNITQGSATSKLQVRELKITADTEQADQFSYRLVISQGKKITKPLNGKLSVSLTGNIDKQSKTIKLNEHQLKLRHVQVFNGQINLANDMEPKSIKITLIQNKKTTLSKTIDWTVSTSPTQLER